MTMQRNEVVTDWKSAIATMVMILQQIWDLDEKGLWPRHLPNVAAPEARLSAAESALGHPLDPEYRRFLSHADGWRGLYQWVDLFGTSDLVGQATDLATTGLKTLEESGALQATGLRAEQLLPIASSTRDIDLFVLVKSGPSAGHVVWLASTEIDRFPSFSEFFLAMMDYNRAEISDLLQAKKKSGLN